MALKLIKGVKEIDAWLNGTAAELGRLSDGEGLYLLIPKGGGSPRWQFDFSFATKRKTISFGTYPATGLALARDKAEKAREQLAAGVNPSDTRKAQRAEQLRLAAAEKLIKQGKAAQGTFEEVGRRWYETRTDGWAESYQPKIIRRLEMYAFPFIGHIAINGVKPPDIVELCRNAQKGGTLETGLRVLKLCSQVFDYAIAEGTRSESNPCGGVRGALKSAPRKNFAAITKPTELQPLLRAIHSYQGSFVVRCAVQLAVLLMLRPGELRKAEWQDVDLDNGFLRVPVKNLKLTTEEKREQQNQYHYVPLAPQAVAILEELFPLTGRGQYVFAGVGRKNRMMSDGTVNSALRAMGYDNSVVTGHGFRATARTILAEVRGHDKHYLEMQLAHVMKDPHGNAYDRTEFLAQRREIMNDWARYLEDLRLGRDIASKHLVMPAFKPVTARRVGEQPTVAAP